MISDSSTISSSNTFSPVIISFISFFIKSISFFEGVDSSFKRVFASLAFQAANNLFTLLYCFSK